MKNPCLVISNEKPSITVFNTEEAATSAGQKWQAEHGDDPRWQVSDLKVATVIWGDDEYTGVGVFNFTPVVLDRPIAEMDLVAEARRQFYAESDAADPELFIEYDEEADGESRKITVDEYLDTTFTLIGTLPGLLKEIAG